MTSETFLDGRVTLHLGDCIQVLQGMEADSVDCVVTSPPYWGLRSYDENAIRIDPSLPKETREWLVAELARRGIDASY